MMDFSFIDQSIKDDSSQKLQGGTVTTNCKSEDSSVQLDTSFEDLGLDEYYV